jgi:hypothetical protein
VVAFPSPSLIAKTALFRDPTASPTAMPDLARMVEGAFDAVVVLGTWVVQMHR